MDSVFCQNLNNKIDPNAIKELHNAIDKILK